ncbi:MAG: efflux RND transporter periplasmic adaptor subunit [Planctomycetaceae bacterium]|nr:efflux RND transporter periplasmic adaptor subunit [Planctomycetaceae bacterium]
MADTLDLRQLAVNRTAPPPSAPERKRPRAYLSRIVLPIVLFTGFAGLVGWAARDQFIGRTPVRVVPVSVSRAELRQSGTPLFQAAGWIEPRPRPILVTALAEGVLEDVFVIEGQDVEAGAKIATLIDTDVRLAAEQAAADRDIRQSEVDSARAEETAARQRLEQPLHLTSALADAESALAKVESERARLPTLIEAADATQENTRRSLASKESLGDAIAGRVLQQARADHQIAVSQRKELDARRPRLEEERTALAKKRDAVEQQLKLLVEEKRQLADAEAKRKGAEARLRQAELSLKGTHLRLDRMTVRAPQAGRVLSVIGRPGTRVMGLDPGGESRSSTVVTMYEPSALQARVDVRLEDVGHVVPGQSVTMESAATAERLVGRVVTATSQANIQKNTLEVKVAIDAPPAALRPEMIINATFLAPELPAKSGSGSEAPERIFVPRPLVDGTGAAATAWVAAHDGSARKRSLKLGGNGPGDLVEVISGLNPTDRLIADGRDRIADGQRIQILGDDTTFTATPR